MSLTGNTRKFVNKLGLESLEISPTNPFVEVDYDYIVIVPTYENEATEIMKDFLETGDNLSHCRGIAGGGNLNFAQLYCFTAKDFARDYNLPLIHCFEFQGNQNDLRIIQDIANETESKDV